MTRHLDFSWPASAGSGGLAAPVRILAVSDQRDDALDAEKNRHALEPLDLIVGCGDLEPDYLCMLADAFRVPLLYVLGNHDRGLVWQARRGQLPDPLPDGGGERINGLEILGLSWPGDPSGRADRDTWAAWMQVLRRGLRPRRPHAPLIVISHVPPLGAGDDPADPFHRGFRAYAWLAHRLRPSLWLHGHTTVATQASVSTQVGGTRYVNVTGSVLLQLRPGQTTRADGAPT
jgi:uncharacterized protein